MKKTKVRICEKCKIKPWKIIKWCVCKPTPEMEEALQQGKDLGECILCHKLIKGR